MTVHDLWTEVEMSDRQQAATAALCAILARSGTSPVVITVAVDIVPSEDGPRWRATGTASLEMVDEDPIP